MSMARVERLEAVLDELAAEDITGIAQGEIVLALERVSSRLDAERSRRLREMDSCVEHTAWGHKTLKGFLAGRTRCSGGAAFRQVRRARQLGALAETRQAWAAG